MNKQFKKNQKAIISFNALEKFRISKSQLKAIKGGEDIVIQDVIEQ